MHSSSIDGSVDLMDGAMRLLRHGRVIVGIPIILATLFVGVSLVLPREYTASGVFAPQASANSLARFSGVAAQLGVALPTQQANESADFYADLLGSRHVLSQLVLTRYLSGNASDTARSSLIEVYRIHGGDSARREDRAIQRLRSAIDVSVTSKTGVVAFRVTSKDPYLSKQIADRALEILNQFNLERRQSRAGAERRFVEGRLEDARADLRAAEDRLQSWLQQNRDYRDSPRLMFEYQRLQNEVTLKEGVVNTLAQAYEQARIDEVRDTPVLTVVDEPTIPSRPDSRRLVAKAVLCLLLGGMGALLLVALSEAADASARRSPEAVTEIRRLIRESFSIRRPPPA
jgi:uncharacterized protein involved in exopolysaccharide biosynthesis